MTKLSKPKSESKSEITKNGAWSGSITFGLLDIPITLMSATKASEHVHLRLLDKHDQTPIRNVRVNSETGKEVSWKNIVKGYEYEKDRYVVLTDEEIKRGDSDLTHTIEIEDFVDIKDVTQTYFDKPYYVLPAARSKKAYTALQGAMHNTGLMGIARITLSTREHLCALISLKNVMLLELLYFDHEIIQLEDISFDISTKITEQERTMAIRLLKESKTTWQPSKYEDRHYDVIKKIALQKAKGGKIHARTAKRSHANNVVDLMTLLKKSIAAKQKKRARVA